ncbi:MAG: FliM/FliN family flagellar motor switch protein [Holosporales bacterium]|jgi:flagellar motor switch protein FliM|nr:FliM/FliN family flagellar motor switch protein [Holosporales bacterium]
MSGISRSSSRSSVQSPSYTTKTQASSAKIDVLKKTNSPSNHLILGLESVFDKFLRKTTVSLRDLAQGHIDAKEERIHDMSFGKYIETLPSPSLMAIFYVAEWNSFSVLRMDEQLLEPFVDSLLGGSVHEQRSKKSCAVTRIERVLIEKIVNVMLSDFSATFSGFTPLRCTLERIEFIPNFAKISHPAREAIVMQARFSVGTQKGTVEFAIPHTAFASIQKDFPALSAEKDLALVWRKHLETEILSVPLEIHAVLRNMTVPLQETLKWRVGTYVPLGMTPSSLVNISCEEKIFFAGVLGRQAQCVAIQIQKVCKCGEFL